MGFWGLVSAILSLGGGRGGRGGERERRIRDFRQGMGRREAGRRERDGGGQYLYVYQCASPKYSRSESRVEQCARLPADDLGQDAGVKKWGEPVTRMDPG